VVVQKKTPRRCHKFPKRRERQQLPKTIEENRSKMPRNNEGRRPGGNRRKSGEFKTCEEGASFVLSETVHQAKKKGDEEEGGRPGNKAEVRQLRGEIRELNTKMENQAEIIKLLQSTLIGCTSRAMHDAYKGVMDELDDPEDATEDWKQGKMMGSTKESSRWSTKWSI